MRDSGRYGRRLQSGCDKADCHRRAAPGGSCRELLSEMAGTSPAMTAVKSRDDVASFDRRKRRRVLRRTNSAPRFPGLTFHAALDTAGAAKVGDGCDILLIRTDEITAELIEAMPRLRLIQALTTGTDHIEALPNLPAGRHHRRGARLSRPGDVGARVPVHAAARARHPRPSSRTAAAPAGTAAPQRLLLGKTAALVGVGRIAEELAKRCKSFRHAGRRRQQRRENQRPAST